MEIRSIFWTLSRVFTLISSWDMEQKQREQFVHFYLFLFAFQPDKGILRSVYSYFNYAICHINLRTSILTRKPVDFMQSWNRTSHFKSHLLLIWNFQMRLEMRYVIWNFWNSLKLQLLIWNFQMRLEMRCAIWNFWNLKLLKPIMGS